MRYYPDADEPTAPRTTYGTSPATAWWPGGESGLARLRDLYRRRNRQVAFEYVPGFRVYHPEVGAPPQLNGRACLSDPRKYVKTPKKRR
jgi:hypothetical protein